MIHDGLEGGLEFSSFVESGEVKKNLGKIKKETSTSFSRSKLRRSGQHLLLVTNTAIAKIQNFSFELFSMCSIRCNRFLTLGGR